LGGGLQAAINPTYHAPPPGEKEECQKKGEKNGSIGGGIRGLGGACASPASSPELARGPLKLRR